VTTTSCAPSDQRSGQRRSGSPRPGTLPSTRKPRYLPKALTVTLVGLGIAFLAVGIIYVAYEAGGLPPMFPGRNPGSTDHHLKHGVISFAIAGIVWSAAWVASWRPVERQFAFRGAGL
jgi:hypothetical protein